MSRFRAKKKDGPQRSRSPSAELSQGKTEGTIAVLRPYPSVRNESVSRPRLQIRVPPRGFYWRYQGLDPSEGCCPHWHGTCPAREGPASSRLKPSYPYPGSLLGAGAQPCFLRRCLSHHQRPLRFMHSSQGSRKGHFDPRGPISGGGNFRRTKTRTVLAHPRDRAGTVSSGFTTGTQPYSIAHLQHVRPRPPTSAAGKFSVVSRSPSGGGPAQPKSPVSPFARWWKRALMDFLMFPTRADIGVGFATLAAHNKQDDFTFGIFCGTTRRLLLSVTLDGSCPLHEHPTASIPVGGPHVTKTVLTSLGSAHSRQWPLRWLRGGGSCSSWLVPPSSEGGFPTYCISFGVDVFPTSFFRRSCSLCSRGPLLLGLSGFIEEQVASKRS